MAVAIKPWRILSILTEEELNFLSKTCEGLGNGDIICAGVYMGGDVIEISRVVNPVEKSITVIDSFDGLNEAHEPDLQTDNPMVGGQCRCDMESVIEYLTAYDVRNVFVHKMWITEETLKDITKSKLSLLWLDLDRYMPTYACLKTYWGWINPGGIILIHDYGFAHTPGVKTAVEQFDREVNPIHLGWQHQVGGIWGTRKVG